MLKCFLFVSNKKKERKKSERVSERDNTQVLFPFTLSTENFFYDDEEDDDDDDELEREDISNTFNFYDSWISRRKRVCCYFGTRKTEER